LSLEPGSLIAHYRLIEQIGRGGMGVVWTAEDTRLGRQVAIKMLPPEFGADAERLARFDREARLLASLNHPNIGALYAIEVTDGERFLVLELIPGETLEDRIGRGPIPVEEALPIARQIALALGAAHAAGILHRDLKPANVKVTPTGTVKVLDFGLAKEIATGGRPAPEASVSPTLTAAATQAGVILGTAAYMSPEQARGHGVDRRTDVWGFGCILYEMLAGRRAFEGNTASDTLASVLKEEPDWSVLPGAAPPAIRRLLRRSLAKDPARRLHDIADALLDLDEATEERGDVELPANARADRRRPLLPWILLVAVGAASAWNAWRAAGPGPAPMATVTASILPPSAVRFDLDRGIALSPDGSRLAVVVRGEDGVRRLWLRPLDREDGAVLEGTEGASIPFWSPDSRSIAFAVAGTLKKIDVATGVVESIASYGLDDLSRAGGQLDVAGGTWGTSGQILLGGRGLLRGSIHRIPEGGGEPVTVMQPEKEQIYQWPTFLPDGKHFLFMVRDYGGEERQGEIHLGSLDGGPSRALVRANSNAVYAAPGFVIWWYDGNLRAQRFDADRLALMGDPFVVATGTRFDPRSGYAAFTVSTAGTLAFQRSTGPIGNELAWIDRDGRDQGVLGPTASYYGPAISPDGSRVACDISDETNRGDIWLLDVARGAATRLTSWPEDDSEPVWSPDGKDIAFFSTRGGTRPAVYVRSPGATGEPRLVTRDTTAIRATSWSRDGHLLLDRTGEAGNDIEVYSVRDRSMRPYQAGPFEEWAGAFSPDGRLVAFSSNETGESEIYLATFPDAGERWRVSADGGSQAVWRRDGRELFFISPRGELMAVPVEIGGTGRGGVTIGVPRPLFRVDIKEHERAQFDTIDGKRFLVNRNVDPGAGQPLTLVLQPFTTAGR
jgi:Tol biopolymer transport system component